MVNSVAVIMTRNFDERREMRGERERYESIHLRHIGNHTYTCRYKAPIHGCCTQAM